MVLTGDSTSIRR